MQISPFLSFSSKMMEDADQVLAELLSETDIVKTLLDVFLSALTD